MYKKMKTNEAKNIALSDSDSDLKLSHLTEYEVQGPFFETLKELGISLVVSREYEHFMVLLANNAEVPMQTALEIPHPSGMCYDSENSDLIVASTRTPHQIFRFRAIDTETFSSDIIPPNFKPTPGIMYMPYRSVLLPGDLYLHDVCLMQGELYATITGKNFLAKIDMNSGWERVWWPECVDELGKAGFDQNYLQFNSIAAGATPENSYYTSFSQETGGNKKPWEDGYGPKGRGVLFNGESRKSVIQGLTCPHSARFHQNKVWLCNSGYGSVGTLNPDEDLDPKERYQETLRVPGFTRGMSFHGDYGFVGLSKVISFYEPYAPGLVPEKSLCGVVIFNVVTGEEVARLYWPEGYQIYEVVVLPNISNAMLPMKKENDKFNWYLRYLG